MNNKKIVLKLGHYSLNPKDAEDTIAMVPDDAIFFTGGEREVGDSKHVGAYHVLMMSKAEDEQLQKASQQIFNSHVVTYNEGRYTYKTFRINGYGLVYIYDCIPVEGIEFTDVDIVNNLFDIENHPIYTVLFNDHCAFCNVTRINRINSYHKVDCTSIQVYSQIGSRYYPMIHSNTVVSLYDAIVPFHEFRLYFPDEEYGKELFDEALYTVLSEIYPEMKRNLKGYDLTYLYKVAEYCSEKSAICNRLFRSNENINEVTSQIGNDLIEFAKTHPNPPVMTDIDDIMSMKKKLPLKNETQQA